MINISHKNISTETTIENLSLIRNKIWSKQWDWYQEIFSASPRDDLIFSSRNPLNLTITEKDLYTEKYKILMKETEEETNK